MNTRFLSRRHGTCFSMRLATSLKRPATGSCTRAGNWDVDVFAGVYEGLTLAEIEIASEDDLPALPKWLGREVTGNKRYSNRAMAVASCSRPRVHGALDDRAAL